MKLLHLEGSRILGWYEDTVSNRAALHNYVEIEDEVWMKALEANSNSYENGEFKNEDFRTVEDKALDCRIMRDNLLNDIEWRVSRYERQKLLSGNTTDSDKWYNDALIYMQKLRDVPQQAGFPLNVDFPEFPEH